MYLVFACSLIALAQPAIGWGDVGHRTVGYLAEKYFTDEAARWANNLLANNNGWDISDAAVFADQVKHKRPYTAGWHYIDAQDSPPQSCGVTFKRDCAEKNGCIVAAITNQTSIVLSSEYSHTVRQEALMYLIHFLGDIHQPLHVENLLRGGNGIHVCFDHRCAKASNLHGIWDTDIIHKINGLKHVEKHNEEKEAAAKWAEQLHSSNQRNKIASVAGECDNIQDPESCSMEWATEANKLVCSYVLAPGVEWLEDPANDLGGDYYEGAAPIVEAQVTKAGVRLAAWINALASASGSGSSFVVQDDQNFLGNIDL